MAKIQFSHTGRRFSIAEYAIAKPHETAIEAVTRSIERTTGCVAHKGRVNHWTEDRDRRITSETHCITLTGPKSKTGGYPVRGEIQVTIYI